jgi:hypothetical protein
MMRYVTRALTHLTESSEFNNNVHLGAANLPQAQRDCLLDEAAHLMIEVRATQTPWTLISVIWRANVSRFELDRQDTYDDNSVSVDRTVFALITPRRTVKLDVKWEVFRLDCMLAIMRITCSTPGKREKSDSLPKKQSSLRLV